MIRRQGKRGKKKADDKRKAKQTWFRQFGEVYCHDDGTHDYIHVCQSCGRPLALSCADFSHKIPAGRGGDEQPTNGIASCRACHSWLERGEDCTSARIFIIQTEVDLTKDLVIHWPEKLNQSLQHWIETWN